MHVLGVDLGTTNSCAAVMDFGKPLMVPVSGGSYTLPSVVAFDSQGRYLLGDLAKRQAAENPGHTVSAIKRLLGRSFADPATRRAMAAVTYRCVEGPHGDVRVATGGHAYAVAQMSALILGELRARAEAHFQEEICQAVIAVPAYFNDRQRHATKDAGQIAGLQVLGVINEPTAAALAHGVHQGRTRRIGVYDLGGGTFDASVLRVGGGVVQVLASGGDAFLGGHDFDDRIFAWLASEVERDAGVGVQKDLRARQRLREAAEAAKVALSVETTTEIGLPFLTTRSDGECVHYDSRLSREVLENHVGDLMDRTIELFATTIADAGLEPGDLEEVFLVGGMTRMPAVRRRVQELCRCEPSVAVHPDLVVAVGAAIQGDLLARRTGSEILIDVTPHNLGILTVAGMAETIIPKDTSVPAAATKRFTTVRDGQDCVEIVAFQGNSRTLDKNQVLGEFRLEGLRPAPRGAVEIEVTFSISADGIVSVTAIDTETRREQAIRIANASALSADEIATMVDEHDRILDNPVTEVTPG